MSATIQQRMAPGGYPQQGVAQAQQMTPEKLKQLSDAVVNEYAKRIVQGIQKMFADENAACAQAGLADKDVGVAKISLPDGKIYSTKFRSESLNAAYSDKGIDSKIAKLDPANGYIYNALLKRTEQLIDQPYTGFIRYIHAKATGTLNQNVLEKGGISQADIFKTQVYVCASRMPNDHKIVILKGVSK